MRHDHWNAPKARTQGDLLEDTLDGTHESAYVSLVGSRYAEVICPGGPSQGLLEYGQVASSDGLFGALNLTEPA